MASEKSLLITCIVLGTMLVLNIVGYGTPLTWWKNEASSSTTAAAFLPISPRLPAAFSPGEAAETGSVGGKTLKAETETAMRVSYPPWNESFLQPEFMIIGEQKCGTTALYYWLSHHPGFRKPKRKEVCFFTSAGRGRNMTWPEYQEYFPLVDNLRPRTQLIRELIMSQAEPGKGWNKELFEDLMRNPSKPYPFLEENQAAASFPEFTTDACTNYIMDSRSPVRLWQWKNTMKLVLLTRDPTTRIESAFNYGLRADWKDFQKALKDKWDINWYIDEVFAGRMRRTLLAQGYYLRNLQRFLKMWPKDQILVIVSEEMFKYPERVFQRMLDFLEIPRFSYEKYVHQKINAAKDEQFFKHDVVLKLDEERTKKLRDHYRPFNEEWFKFLNIPNVWDYPDNITELEKYNVGVLADL